jgi:2'-5' RNA ligase
VRLFAGIALDDVARQRCANVADSVRRTGFEARYEAPQKYHITLAFLGNVPLDRIAPVEAVVDSLSGMPAFRIVLDRLGAFPQERRPRVVFIGARERHVAFANLSKYIREAYASLGFKLDDDPVAHVTIARLKAPVRSLPLVEVPPIEVRVAQISLFASFPDRANDTSRYEIRAATALATPT